MDAVCACEQARQGAVKRANSSRRRDPPRQGSAQPLQLQEQPPPAPVRPQPSKPRGGLLPWQQQRSSDKPAGSDSSERMQPSAAVSAEPDRKPRKRLTPNLMPWRKSSQQEDTQEHDAAEEEVAPNDPAPSQQKQRGAGKLFGGLGLGRMASSTHEEEQEDEQYEAEPAVSRGNGRPSLPKKLLPWLKTSGSTS